MKRLIGALEEAQTCRAICPVYEERVFWLSLDLISLDV